MIIVIMIMQTLLLLVARAEVDLAVGQKIAKMGLEALYIYIYIYLSISLSLSIYIYIYICWMLRVIAGGGRESFL